jgi:exonuclease VII small subunit
MNHEEKSLKELNADGALEKAVEHLHEAEGELEAARELEKQAEKKIHEAEAEIEDAVKHHGDEVWVHVTHVNDLESVDFKMSIHATLQNVLSEAYDELEIKPQPKDIFQTAGEPPISLMSHLGLTLEQARDRGIITDFRFQIVSETGGA